MCFSGVAHKEEFGRQKNEKVKAGIEPVSTGTIESAVLVSRQRARDNIELLPMSQEITPTKFGLDRSSD